MSGLRRRAAGAAGGVVIDRLVGEPPSRGHPVAAFGHTMQALEAGLYRDRRWAGVVHAAAGLALGAGSGALVGSTAIATAVAVAGRALAGAAGPVAAALDGDDLVLARSLLPSLVGRDPTGLDGAEISRATVESVAENTVDAVVGPALWAAVGGAPGALGYRAVNTMDAMVGHRSDRYRRYGWASARLDDAAAWVPARATAVLVAVVRPRRAAAVWTAVRRQAPAHPSPNAGVAEAAFAAALGLSLGGTNRYGDRFERRPTLGAGPAPGPGDIGRSVRLSLDVGAALVASLAGAAVVPSLVARR
ncbi:MAG: cobalamin biosynthesis protein [Actinobacteria bacterium]|nr:cobalamin biosynthesis protein [Actinomycetota bacterium]